LAVLAAGGSSSAGAAPLPNCTVANNLEAIIDDSGSMSITDPQRFRADMVDILATFNTDKTMGGVQFGSDASVLFAHGPVDTSAVHASLAAIQADDGGTDYEAGFNLANSENPMANARIFLSDGAPNFDPDPNVWKAPPIKAYVVGFGSVDPAVLNQIAADTGGPAPFNVTNTSQLRTVAMIINARINCEPDPNLLTRSLKAGQVKKVAFVPDGGSSQVVISWPGHAKIQALGFTQGGGGHASSLAESAKGHVQVKQRRGRSYVAVNLTGLSNSRVHFKLRAKKAKHPVRVTTAIIP
jgi:von Willebrand factor type A domain